MKHEEHTDLHSATEPENWSATVRKVDSGLHAAFARQEREAARKQPFWKRGGRGKTSSASSSNDRKHALQGSGF